MVKLTLENLSSKLGKRVDVATTKELSIVSKQIDELGSFAKMTELEKVDFSGNYFRFQRDIEKLFEAPNLKEIKFNGCQVCKTANYRSFIISKCPKLEVLDGAEVTDDEREQAKRLAAGENPEEAKAAARAEEEKKRKEDERVAQLQIDREAREQLLAKQKTERDNIEAKKEADRALFNATRAEMAAKEAEEREILEEAERKEREEIERLEEESRKAIEEEQRAKDAEKLAREAEKLKISNEKKEAEEAKKEAERSKKEEEQKKKDEAKKKENDEKNNKKAAEDEKKRIAAEEKAQAQEAERLKKEAAEKEKKQKEGAAKRATSAQSDDTLKSLSRKDHALTGDEDDLFAPSSSFSISKGPGSSEVKEEKVQAKKKTLFDDDDLFGSNPFGKSSLESPSNKSSAFAGLDTNDSLNKFEARTSAAKKSTIKIEDDLFSSSTKKADAFDDLFSSTMVGGGSQAKKTCK